MKEVKLPSGAALKISEAPFSDAKNLYQAVLDEMRAVNFGFDSDLTAVFKDLACIGFSSKKVDAALEPCMKRCLYNGLKIDTSTFEKSEARKDYVSVCVAVLKENIEPFMNGLYAEFQTFLKMMNTKNPK